MSTEKDFLDLLNSIAQEQQYGFDLPRQEATVPVKFKTLTTLQLKELVKTAVDSPLTQSVFNSTATKIFKDSLVSIPANVEFTIVDRLLFLIETRIQSISPTKKVKIEDKEVDIDYKLLWKGLHESIKANIDLFAPVTSTSGTLTITYGVPLIDTEVQLEEEIYKNVEIKIDTADELRKVVGEAFIHEIAKAIHTITIGETNVELSQTPFKSRLKVVESLPASIIQQVVEYIEQYKNIINTALVVKEYNVPIDSTLFSV